MPKESLEENLLTLLCWSDNHSAVLAKRVTVKEFSADTWRRIATVALKYIEHYGKPPQIHLYDLLEKELREEKDEMFKFALYSMERIHERINPDYVMAELDHFLEIRNLNKCIGTAIEALRKENLPAVYEPLEGAIVYRMSGPRYANLTLPTADDLSREQLPALRWIVPDFIPEGVTLLAGPPKIGKSLMVLNVALACTGNGKVLDRTPQQTSILYVSLEDNKRRLQSRMNAFMDGRPFTNGQHHLYYQFTVPTLDDGLIPQIECWLDQHPDIKLVTLDTWGLVRGRPKNGEKEYDYDVRMMKKVLSFAQQRGASFIIVHHTTKQKSADALEEVGGTHGLTGTVDTIVVLGREKEKHAARLRSKGRDLMEEHDLMVCKDERTGVWSVLGDYIEATPEKRETLAAKITELLEQSGPMHLSDLARELGKNSNVIKVTLSKMSKDGSVCSNGRGVWDVVRQPEAATPEPPDPAAEPPPPRQPINPVNRNEPLKAD